MRLIAVQPKIIIGVTEQRANQMEKTEMSPTTLIFKQNRRRQIPITTMPPLQIRTTHNTLVQLHQHKHTTKGHGFVDGSRGGGESHSHITTEQTVFKLILTKTKVTAFHLRNKEAKRSLKIKWNNGDLENTAYPKYLSVTQDRTLSYKETYRKQR